MMRESANPVVRPIAAAILIAAAGAAIIVPRANAAEIQLERRAVSYADLDLSRPDGVRSLNARVNAAVRAVCKVGYRWSVEEAVQQRACLARARAGASPQVQRAIAMAQAREAERMLASAGE
jgi:UrcA family protein